jgi:hypothetical protein
MGGGGGAGMEGGYAPAERVGGALRPAKGELAGAAWGRVAGASVTTATVALALALALALASASASASALASAGRFGVSGSPPGVPAAASAWVGRFRAGGRCEADRLLRPRQCRVCRSRVEAAIWWSLVVPGCRRCEARHRDWMWRTAARRFGNSVGDCPDARPLWNPWEVTAYSSLLLMRTLRWHISLTSRHSEAIHSTRKPLFGG